jgi:hypothetical protein
VIRHPASPALAVAVVLAGATMPVVVHAQEQQTSDTLDTLDTYEVPRECPGAESFAAEVAKRTATRRPPRGVQITISRAAGGYSGRLTLDGLTRDLHAATCSELAQALALAVASAAEDEDDETSPVPPGPARPSAVLPFSPVWRSDEAFVPKTPPERALELLLGGGIGATSVLGVGVSPELRLFGGIDHGRGWSLRVGGSVVRSAERSTAVGSSRFERWAIQLEGCPATARHASLFISPCGRLTVGALRGMGESVENAESTSLLWLSVATGGRLGIDLGRRVFVEAEAQVVLPLLRHGFYVRPNEVVQRVPVLGVDGSIALGYRFSK